MINKEEVLAGIRNRRVVVFKDAIKATPAWSVFEDLYDKALEFGKQEYGTFPTYGGPATLAIDHSEELVESFNPMIEMLSEVHPGNKIGVFSIIHFYNSSNNEVPEAAQSFKDKFVKNNPDKIFDGFDMSLFKATRHSDPVDGFFIQCNGSALWKVFYEDSTDEHLMNPGDILYIPKGLEHSVESLTVRSSLSIAFYDAE